MSRNYEWYVNANLEKEAGNWIVIVDEKIVASGKDLKQLLDQTDRKFEGKESLIAKVPTKDTLIL